MKTTWKKSLSLLQSEVNESVFAAWFLPMHELGVDSESITLGVPNKFFESWIRDKYISLIRAAVQQAAGSPLQVRFAISEAPAGEPENPGAPENPADPEKASSSLVSVPGNVTSGEKKQDGKDSGPGWLKSVFSGSRPVSESRFKEFGLNPNYSFDNFVVGGSNRFAHAASLAVCEKLSKVYNPLFLYGGVGLGKTHLMQAMGQETLKRHPKARVLYLSSEEFTNQLIGAIRTKTTAKFRGMYRNVDILLIDDIQFIAGKESTQEEFFHTFNALHDAHKQIVLCSDRSPQDISSLEERLVSRFAWGLIADVQAPDFETRVAIMEKKSETSAVKVPKETLYFLAENIKTNIREMEGALIRVVAYAKLTGAELSVDLSREVLKGMLTADEKKITIPVIQKIVASFYGVDTGDMKTKKRTRVVVYPRQVAMYLSRTMTDHSLPDIGGFFGGRDHTTVIHACGKIGREIKENQKTRAVVERLASLVKEK